jgi:hypothetical protein
MLTRILHHSLHLRAFLDQLHLDLSEPQRQPMLKLADALLVCEDDTTLAALQRQFLDAPDASNMADFLRISPWQEAGLRAAVRTNQVQSALAQAERMGLAKVITLTIDHSLGEKDKATSTFQSAGALLSAHTAHYRYKTLTCVRRILVSNHARY